MDYDTHDYPGVLVTLEGIDGAGKGTVLEALRDEFPEARFTEEPNESNRIGKLARWALKSEEVSDLALFHLFVADHHQHEKEIIAPELSSGALVVSDRYIDSRYVYQSISLADLIPGSDNNVMSWITSVQEGPETVILPNLTILLDIPVEESFRRKEDDTKERYEKVEFLSKTRERYHKLAEMYPERYVTVDGTQDPAVVAQECVELVRNAYSTSA